MSPRWRWCWRVTKLPLKTNQRRLSINKVETNIPAEIELHHLVASPAIITTGSFHNNLSNQTSTIGNRWPAHRIIKYYKNSSTTLLVVRGGNITTLKRRNGWKSKTVLETLSRTKKKYIAKKIFFPQQCF